MQGANGARPAGLSGAGNRKQSIHKKMDRHTSIASLLLKADLAPDPLERMLAISRVVITYTLDLLRAGQGMGETPVVILGQHIMSHRDLAEKHRGDAVVVMLQEICSYDPEARVTHIQGKARGPEVAELALQAVPSCAVRAARGALGTLGQVSAAPYVEVTLKGNGRVSLPRQDEVYTFTLPLLHLTEPLAEVCPLELAGNCTVTCPATGLTLTLKFRDEHSVKGSIVKRGSEARIAIFSGRWDGAVNVEVPDLGAGGTVSNARALAPAVVPWVNLAQPGPRRLTRLWSAILQSMYFMDVHQAAAFGKRAEALATDIVPLLKGSLLYEVAEGIKAGKKGEPTAIESAQPPTREPALPPAIRKAHADGRALVYQLHYSVQTMAD
ncbi:hypothetical protein ACKKBG_A29890 [Auxenochlorella protothecoides x Auxenochlorella symbiontica]